MYGGRSRFMTDKVLKCFEARTFQGSMPTASGSLQGEAAVERRRRRPPQGDVVSRCKSRLRRFC